MSIPCSGSGSGDGSNGGLRATEIAERRVKRSVFVWIMVLVGRRTGQGGIGEVGREPGDGWCCTRRIRRLSVVQVTHTSRSSGLDAGKATKPHADEGGGIKVGSWVLSGRRRVMGGRSRRAGGDSHVTTERDEERVDSREFLRCPDVE